MARNERRGAQPARVRCDLCGSLWDSWQARTEHFVRAHGLDVGGRADDERPGRATRRPSGG